MSKPKKIIRTKRLYRKRQRPKWIGTLLFILFLLLLVGFGYLFSKEWMVRFGTQGQTSTPSPSSSVEISSTAPTPDSSGESSEPVSSEPQRVELAVTGLKMTAVDQVKTGEALKAYLDKASAAGFNAIYVELKGDDGIISYDTTNELAKQYGTVSKTPIALDTLVNAIKDAGLLPVARISALKDPLAAHVRNGNSYGYGGSTEVNWLDDSVQNGGKPWLNPYMENTRTYLSSLCKEAADRGFSCIVLENVSFPLKNTEKMGTINESVPRDQILGQLVSECRTAAGEARVFAAYTPVTLTKFGTAPLKAMGGQLSPTLDLKAIETGRKAITELLSPGVAETYTAADIVKVLLDETLSGDDECLPLIPAADLETVRPILEVQGCRNYIVL